ncbi:MAG: hypothetical protein CMQ27_05470 [Gammaproteobacteria bacterium]|nr:hypothetical protein [Gammaproteobacteria bacterium]
MKRDREEDNILWAVKSPPLIFSRENIWPEAEWFRSWEVTVTGTESLKPNRKLGIYFENALQEWIAQEPRLALLANNLVVRSKTHTLGEFDLIVRNENWTEHWEIAVKFFLGICDRKNINHWIGPNPQDTLARKLDSLQNRQIRLGDNPEAKRTLQQRGIEIDKRRIIFKGRLFHPYKVFKMSQFEVPKDINLLHEKGWWLRWEELDYHEELKNLSFKLLKKEEWLAPLQFIDKEDLISFDELKNGCADTFTRHAAIIKKDGAELSRGFVVSEDWEAQASTICPEIAADAAYSKDLG